MKIELSHRHYGKYTTIKRAKINIHPNEIIKEIGKYEYEIQEEKLLDLLPDNFLPCLPRHCLLTVDDETSGTGIKDLKIFRPFAKYFDSYAISLFLPENELQKEKK